MVELYDIIKVPDPVLKETAKPIENIDAGLRNQINAMMNTMYHGAGIGLAANQVNKLNRVFVMDVPEGCWQYGDEIDGVMTIETGYRSGEREEEMVRKPMALINPEVVWSSDHKSVYEEGCLSIPQQYGEVIRPAQVRVKFQDIEGNTQEELFAGLDSHCVQHEIDHLNGILFIDYLSTLKRNMILRKMKKLQKETAVL